MGENQNSGRPCDYLRKLAARVAEHCKTEQLPDTIIHAEKVNSLLEQPEQLARFIEDQPRLQEQLAYFCDFTPNRWLLMQEQPAVNDRRKLYELVKADYNTEKGDVYAWAKESKLQGICFSGGGIRSATFNLGILQGLAGLDSEGKMLKRFDYLSSVSGGGYIHEWFAAWVQREGFESVREQLIPLPGSAKPFHPEQIRWLRRYSNYLTPQKGFLTGDTWVAVAIWLRNTFLNQVILVSGLFFLLYLPIFTTRLFRTWPSLEWFRQTAFLPLAAVCFAIGVACFTFTLRREYKRIRHEKASPKGLETNESILTAGTERTIQLFVMLPLLLSGAFYLNHVVNSYPPGVLDIAVVFLFQWVLVASLAFAGASLKTYMMAHGLSDTPDDFWKRIFWRVEVFLEAVGLQVLVNSALAAAGGALFFCAVCRMLRSHLPSSVSLALGQPEAWRFQVTFGPPLLLVVSFLSLVLGAGLIGRDFEDWLREWLGRVRAWALLFGILWALYFGIALLGPYFLKLSSTKFPVLLKGVKWSAAVAWLVTTAGAVLAGQSTKTGGEKDAGMGQGSLSLLAKLGPHVFILGLLLLISSFAAYCFDSDPRNWQFWMPLAMPLFIFLVFGFRVDINEFSMNTFYRNRLTRCYLGATNKKRDPNPLTGFDDRDTDQMKMSKLVPPGAQESSAAGTANPNSSGYQGPFPIVCTTINLTFGEDLAWQERKAASFAFTPLYSGYHVGWTTAHAKHELSFNGFVPTRNYAVPQAGINMATAVAISGAAASPNWGYHTNPAIAFLLTMFNVRLGWWLFNPRRSKCAGTVLDEVTDPREPTSPRFAPVELAKELLGMTNDASKYIYLSDGGHFDNMGLYELVRRHCYRIVICDAEQDSEFRFEGIAGAIRKCRIDFGVEIDLDLSPLRPNKKTGYCKQHHATGTIKYRGDSDNSIGQVLYIKSSLTGPIEFASKRFNEPADILNYKLEHSAFPHDTTANQWFTESQFESYRRLGQHIVEEIEKCGAWERFK